MVNSEELMEALKRKGLLSEEDVDTVQRGVKVSLIPRNFLTQEELEEVCGALGRWKPESPTGFAHGILVHAQKEAKAGFHPDKVYDYCGLVNFTSTLYATGLVNKGIFRKLEAAIERARRYEK
jgi:hypothetical protein